MTILIRYEQTDTSDFSSDDIVVDRSAAKPELKMQVVEQTFLKALPNVRADLTRYIVANWVAMDQRGVELGIFTSHALYEETAKNGDWDLVVAVGYPQPEGHDDPHAQAAFKEIRRSHNKVLVNGKGLTELGSIVGHHKLKIVAA